MEHSKLPWKKEECKLHSGHFDITGNDGRIITCVKGDREKYADFIVTACNQHDTLQAKADLFDELLDKINSFETQRHNNPQPVLLEFAWNDVIGTYRKAEALTCTNPKK